MKLLVTSAALLLSLTSCNVYKQATSARPDVTQPWRGIATDADRERLRNWRKAWDEALPAANCSMRNWWCWSPRDRWRSPTGWRAGERR